MTHQGITYATNVYYYIVFYLFVDGTSFHGPVIIVSKNDKRELKEGSLECYDIQLKMEEDGDFESPTEIQVKLECRMGEKSKSKVSDHLDLKDNAVHIAYSNSTLQCAEALLDLALSTSDTKVIPTNTSFNVKKSNLYPVRLNSDWVRPMDFIYQQILSDHNYALCRNSVKSNKFVNKVDPTSLDSDLHTGAQMLSDFCDDMQKLYGNREISPRKGGQLLYNKKTSRFELKQKENIKNKMCTSYGPKPVGRPRFSTAKKKKVSALSPSKSASRMDPYEFTEIDDHISLPPVTSPARNENPGNPRIRKVGRPIKSIAHDYNVSPAGVEKDDKFSNFQLLMSCLEHAESQGMVSGINSCKINGYNKLHSIV